MTNLTFLVTEGQRLVEDAREQRTADYAARCEAWRLKVEQALKRKPLALAMAKLWPLPKLKSHALCGQDRERY
jgi:hypothetical protein